MAKTVSGLDDDGRVYKHKLTRHQRKSERAGEIPWSKGPSTRWQKFVRAAIH